MGMDLKSRVKYGTDGGADWGGTPSAGPGKYKGVFEEGIELKVHEESGAKSVQIPVKVVEGTEEGKRFFIFLNATGEDWMIERSFTQLCVLLDATDLAGFFEDKYKRYDTLFDEAIIAQVVKDLQIKLPDKIAGFETSLESYKNKAGEEKQSLRIRKVWPVGRKGGGTGKAATTSGDAAASSEENWG